MSRESIVKELPTDLVRKMQNWVNSRTGNGYAMTSAYEGGAPSSGYAETIVPVLVGEAADVDEAMKHLPNVEKKAIRLFWECDSASLSWIARKIGVKGGKRTERVVRNAHRMLRDELAALKQIKARYSEQAEFLGANA